MAKHNAKGRSKGQARFVMVTHHMLDTPAGKSLSPHEMAGLIRIMQVYGGSNNGCIAMSSRTLASMANMNKDTAAKVILSLTEKGFLNMTKPAGFGTGGRRSAEFEITCFPLRDKVPAKNSFQHWRPTVKENPSSQNRATTVPKQGREPMLRVV